MGNVSGGIVIAAGIVFSWPGIGKTKATIIADADCEGFTGNEMVLALEIYRNRI